MNAMNELPNGLNKTWITLLHEVVEEGSLCVYVDSDVHKLLKLGYIAKIRVEGNTSWLYPTLLGKIIAKKNKILYPYWFGHLKI